MGKRNIWIRIFPSLRQLMRSILPLSPDTAQGPQSGWLRVTPNGAKAPLSFYSRKHHEDLLELSLRI